MKHLIRISLFGSATLLLGLGNVSSVLAVGEQSKNLIIAEVSPENSGSGSKEYVQIYNPNTFGVNVAGWRLQYRSASHTPDDGKDWSNRAILGCQSTKISDCAQPLEVMVGAGELLRLSSFETGDGLLPLASGMATSGGELRLVQPSTDGKTMNVHDRVGYGEAKDFEGSGPAPSPMNDRSIARRQASGGEYIDSDNNNADFALSEDENSDQPATADTGGGTASQDNQPEAPRTYLDAEITEVMPDPVSPQLDSADEFIELYNPYDDALNLKGYTLKTGSDWSHKFTIGDLVVNAHGYIVLTSAETHLSLSNSGSGVRLYDPNGRLVYEASNYGKAQAGNSWVRDGSGKWVWTTKPTPGQQNIVDAPAPVVTSAKTATAKKAKATTSSAKKASSSKTSSLAKSPISNVAEAGQGGSGPGNTVGMWALGIAGLLGVGYGAYEYRQDIAGFVRRKWAWISNIGSK